ncbi:DUF262 domain-containing protein [Flavobacterium branchiophilum]|uniref:Uncharacterized protein n=1 Tax=Flavobacterium branchiophilum (strain FL-15) TaxID=1034807 RepID=G2Z1R8_FLABF|nr:DUF262 domain-containing protein [Flavobacterium branchiophilum]CCB69853.1 Hypothetical protein FBFL15_1796 [Flavobacterium branchiophilum FL-15]
MEEVLLKTENLSDLLGLKFENESLATQQSTYLLSIPDYQRIYCWEEKNVLKLLDDISDFTDSNYHLGNIILHKTGFENDIKYNIVDGQQRLVTLTLLLSILQPDIKTSLLDECFQSEEARDYIAYNKFLIRNYIENNLRIKELTSKLITNIQFSVLIIEEGSLDLAYTFFSNQNSRGKALTDYDLLKAHHLRFVHIQEQAEHLATRWDSIIINSDNDDSTKDLARTLGIYLFRLRKWMRKREWSNDEKYKVKAEFEAASVIKEIPAFGEQFNYYESIQGGSHFFAYTDSFIYKFKTFSQTSEYNLLKKHLSNENHWWYRDVIEAFLFAYYLKFGTIYLGEALKCIAIIVSDHRYNNSRAYLKTLLKYAGEIEIAMMIDQATSPTFILAELKNTAKTLSIPKDLNGTRFRYNDAIKKIEKEIDQNSHS